MSSNKQTTRREPNQESVHVLNVFADVYTEEMASTIRARDELAADLEHQTDDAVTMSTVVPEGGAASLEDPLDVVTNAPYIVEAVETADEGYDAIVIDCFGDPAVDALRQTVDVPVVGANQAACSIATQLGRTFSIVSVLDETALLLGDLAAKYGFDDQLASIRPIGTDVLDLEQQLDQTATEIAREATTAIKKDGAHVVVLGCTGMGEVRQKVASLLAEDNIHVPLVEPLSAAVQTAVMLSRLSLTQSRAAYYSPREKHRNIDFDLQGTTNE